MTGPPPTPTNILKLRGSWKAKKRPREPSLVGDMPPAPEKFTAAARIEWDRLVPILVAARVIGPAHLRPLELYCEAYSDFDAARAEVEKYGRFIQTEDGRIANPALKAKGEASDRCMRIAAEFGITPSSSTRVQARKPQGDKAKSRFFEGTG